jgi:hypothetical protein
MIEYLGISGLVPPDDADIRNELTCAGREASLGFDAMVGLYGRFSGPAMPASSPNCAGTTLPVAIDHQGSQ